MNSGRPGEEPGSVALGNETSPDQPGGDQVIQQVSAESADGPGNIRTADATSEVFSIETIDATLAATKPLHALIGKWRGVTSRSIGGAKAVEYPEWNWDFLTDPNHPALVVVSSSSPYLPEGRLTWLPDEKVFRLAVVDSNGRDVEYRGTWTTSKESSADDQTGLSQNFRVTFKAIGSSESVQDLTIRLNEEDSYVLEVARQRDDAPPQLYDSVIMKRLNSDPSTNADTGAHSERCIISGSPAAIPIEYDGTTYYACCPGCRAAFLAAPELFIARKRSQPLND